MADLPEYGCDKEQEEEEEEEEVATSAMTQAPAFSTPASGTPPEHLSNSWPTSQLKVESMIA